jgi:hypothetical protein
MPNLHVTDRQVMLYMTRSQQHDQESAAAMAGFSARTARRIDKDPRLPSQKRQPDWRWLAAASMTREAALVLSTHSTSP